MILIIINIKSMKQQPTANEAWQNIKVYLNS